MRCGENANWMFLMTLLATGAIVNTAVAGDSLIENYVETCNFVTEACFICSPFGARNVIQAEYGDDCFDSHHRQRWVHAAITMNFPARHHR